MILLSVGCMLKYDLSKNYLLEIGEGGGGGGGGGGELGVIGITQLIGQA